MTDNEQNPLRKSLLNTGKTRDMKKARANRSGCRCFVMFTEFQNRRNSYHLKNKSTLTIPALLTGVYRLQMFLSNRKARAKTYAAE